MAARFPLFLSFAFFVSTVAAFTFTFRTPSECDDLGLTWTGGTPPFQLGIIPIYGTPRSIDIPSSAFVNGKGSFSIPLPLSRDHEGLLIMSDATGFNAGGSSSVFKVLASQGGVCNSTDAGVAFTFQLNSALQQCRPYVFSGYEGAVQPVTIAAVIPGGNGVLLNPPVGDPSYSWIVNVAHGTSVIFFMTDSRGRQGGSSDVRIVGVSDDSTCLSTLSLGSTTNPPGPSKTTSNTSSALLNPSSTPSPTSSPSISSAGIAGVIVGSVLFLTVAVTLALFVLKRASGKSPEKRRIESQMKFDEDAGQSSQDRLHGVSPSGTPTAATRPYDSNHYYRNSALLPPQPYATDSYQTSNASLTGYYDPSMSFVPPAAVYPPQPTYRHSTQSSVRSSVVDARSPDTPSLLPYAQSTPSQPSTRRSPSSNGSGTAAKPKATMAGTFQTPSRFVIHTDAEDGLVPNAQGVVELPPQYSAMRAPIRLEPPPAGSYS